MTASILLILGAFSWLGVMVYRSTRRPDVPVRLKVGDRAPDVTFDTVEGAVSLSDLWLDAPLVIVWPRHAGCPFYQEQLALLEQQRHRFDDLGAKLVVISATFPKMTEAIAAEQRLGFDVLPDARSRSHSRFELGFTSYRSMIMSRRVNQRYREINRRGFKAHAKRSFSGASDWLRLPGACVIGSDGHVRFIHRASEVCELAPLDEIFTLLDQERSP